MIILLTNDDGIYAEGIQILAKKFIQDEDIKIHIVAPDHERSATGHAITMHRPLRAEQIEFHCNSNLRGWYVNGTPSDCVKLAIEYLLPEKPDLVISGINRGANLGTDVLYSGTVSAGMEASILGIPGIAISLTEREDPDFHFAAEYIYKIIPHLFQQALSPHTLLNINIPGAREEIAGTAFTRLGIRQYHNAFEKRICPRGRSYYWMAGEAVDIINDGEKDTDVAVIKKGYISITPLQFDLTNHKQLDELKQIDWEI